MYVSSSSTVSNIIFNSVYHLLQQHIKFKVNKQARDNDQHLAYRKITAHEDKHWESPLQLLHKTPGV